MAIQQAFKGKIKLAFDYKENENSKVKIGLSQFKEEKEIVKPVKKIKKFEKEVKISDLMRRSA